MICQICKKQFSPSKYNKVRQKYCSLTCRKIGLRENYQRNSKRYWRKHKKEYLKNIERSKMRLKKLQLQYRFEVLIHYGGNPPKCSCCGEDNILFLTIDHIHGGGESDRKKLKGSNFYKYLIDKCFPDGFQVLCSNCNMAKGRNKVQFCPVHHPEQYKIEV
jgi:hypothetical protein